MSEPGRTEHAVICVEGSLHTDSADLAQAYMQANANLAEQLDRLANGGLDGEGWRVVSHDVLLVGERTLTTVVFARSDSDGSPARRAAFAPRG